MRGGRRCFDRRAAPPVRGPRSDRGFPIRRGTRRVGTGRGCATADAGAVVYSREPIPTLTRQAWVEAGGGALTMGWAPAPTLPPFALTRRATPPRSRSSPDVSPSSMITRSRSATGSAAGSTPFSPQRGRAPIRARDRRTQLGPGVHRRKIRGHQAPVLAGIEHDGLRVWGDADRTMGTPAGKLCTAGRRPARSRRPPEWPRPPPGSSPPTTRRATPPHSVRRPGRRRASQRARRHCEL